MLIHFSFSGSNFDPVANMRNHSLNVNMLVSLNILKIIKPCDKVALSLIQKFEHNYVDKVILWVVAFVKRVGAMHARLPKICLHPILSMACHFLCALGWRQCLYENRHILNHRCTFNKVIEVHFFNPAKPRKWFITIRSLKSATKKYDHYSTSTSNKQIANEKKFN